MNYGGCPPDELITIVRLGNKVNHPLAIIGESILPWGSHPGTVEAVDAQNIFDHLGLYVTGVGSAIIIGSGSATRVSWRKRYPFSYLSSI
jgi:hypothetical protein